MDINRENYTKSLENIRPSERFLAETKKLMLEEAAKAEKVEKPSRKPFIMKLTPYAAAAACIALVAVVGVNILKDKGIETVRTGESTYAETSAENHEESAEAASADEVNENKAPANDEAFDEVLFEEIAGDEAEVAESNEVPETEAEPNGDEAAFFAAGADDSTDGADADAGYSDDEWVGANSILPESDGGLSDASDDRNVYTDGGFNYSANADHGVHDDCDDDAGLDGDMDIYDDTDGFDDIYDTSSPVAPAFTKLSGGKASVYPDFSPNDTERLREFLVLVSQDDINAEVTTSDGESDDIFGEKAIALNEAFANAAKKLTPSGGENFVPTFSFCVFDNVSGDIIYTVQTDGSTISVQIKNGETVYFIADKTAVEAVISAAE